MGGEAMSRKFYEDMNEEERAAFLRDHSSFNNPPLPELPDELKGLLSKDEDERARAAVKLVHLLFRKRKPK